MPLSAAAVRALLAQESSESIIALLTIDHDDLPDPIRVARNTVGDDIVSGGETFIAMPFEIEIPTDSEKAPVARLEVPNVDRSIGQALEELASPAVCTIQIVLASEPDTIDREYAQFELRNAEWDALAVTAELTQANFTGEPWPFLRVTPQWFPALFR